MISCLLCTFDWLVLSTKLEVLMDQTIPNLYKTSEQPQCVFTGNCRRQRCALMDNDV